VPNLLCITEPTEILVAELSGVANRVSVILPWGSLLRGIALPETTFLNHLRFLCASDATVEIVFSYDERRDAGQQGRLGFAPTNEWDVRGILAESYERAGFQVASIETISQSGLRLYETTWAKRLSFARPREIWRVRLSVSQVNQESNSP
jgi:hypothetical protein